MKFAVIGVGGYIAPRHLEAIAALGHTVVSAYDTKDSVGIMDRYFPNARFFTEFERFADHLETQKTLGQTIDYVSVCSPNYLHASHIKFALRLGCNVICEKPLVLREAELDDIKAVEEQTGKKVFTVLQLRSHDAIKELKKKVSNLNKDRFDIDLTYLTSRGAWYGESWKGDIRKSGGLSTNIGIHFFDMLSWIFGDVVSMNITHKDALTEEGSLELKRAHINWRLSIDETKLPAEALKAGKRTFRSITIDGETFEFSEGFTELHKTVYKEVLSGQGWGLEAARPAIRVVEQIRKH